LFVLLLFIGSFIDLRIHSRYGSFAEYARLVRVHLLADLDVEPGILAAHIVPAFGNALVQLVEIRCVHKVDFEVD